MTTRSIGAVVAAALLAWAAPALGANTRVGFVNPGMKVEFWLQLAATMQAAAEQLGIDLDIRYTNREHGKTLAVVEQMLREQPLPNFMIATNDIGDGGAIPERVDAAGVPIILLSNDFNLQKWERYGEPRTRYRNLLGSIVPDHEGGGYGIAEAIILAAARIKQTGPLRLLALTGDVETPASNDRIRGMNRAVVVMRGLLGPGTVEVVKVAHLDWTEKTAETWTRGFLKTAPRIDALWAANDQMAFSAMTALREAGYKPGWNVVVGGLNWSQRRIEKVLEGEMLLTHGGHFLGGAWAIAVLRDYHDGRDFAEEDVRLQFPMGAIDKGLARRFPDIGKVDWRQVDFTRFSKTLNPAVTRYDFTPEAALNALPSPR